MSNCAFQCNYHYYYRCDLEFFLLCSDQPDARRMLTATLNTRKERVWLISAAALVILSSLQRNSAKVCHGFVRTEHTAHRAHSSC